MNKIASVSIAFLTLFSFSCHRSTAPKDSNELQSFSTLRIDYETHANYGGIETVSKETHWVDLKNKRTATQIQSETKGMGINQKEEQLNIEDGDWVYSIDLVNQTGTRMNMAQFKEMAKAMGQFIQPDFDNLEEFVKQNGGKMLPNDTFLGKDCTVFEVFGTKQWLYKGQVLKVEMNGQVMRQAVRIEENITIPEDVFKIPEGIKIEDASMEEKESQE
ncbi:MAG: hypothetical protein ACP5O2_04175 [Bacteroidales bacterium]